MVAFERKLLVSLHDVTPRHADAVVKILTWLSQRGLPQVPLLVVPDFHEKWPLSAHPAFCQQLRAFREQGHELVLHGYFHRETPLDIKCHESFRTSFQRRFMTAGEGEFLSLDPAHALERLERGLAMWSESGLGQRPDGFIPPAWLHRADLDEVLWSRGFRWTEDHVGMRFSDGRKLAAPVVTWASRDALRRIGSRLFCPTAVRLQKMSPVLRIAIHPHDFDHPSLVRSIERTLELALRERKSISSTKIDQLI